MIRLLPALIPTLALGAALSPSWAGTADAQAPLPPLYVYTLSQEASRDSYDESVAVASLQGIVNRGSPQVYVRSLKRSRPDYWLDLLQRDGRWLQGRERRPLADLDALVALAGARLKGAIIWDPRVPASLNVATTAAGVKDAVVLSPEYAEHYLPRWGIPVLDDFRGKFTGSETGSPKNDAYRWALREYLSTRKCSDSLLCLFEDAYFARDRGNQGYTVTRDWAVMNRAFVFDLSPWADEVPADDPHQKLGLDAETYQMILKANLAHTAGRRLSELAGFFAFEKYSHFGGHESRHDPVPTEWETVRLITPYNVYQNTGINDCFNESFHSQAPHRELRQHPLPVPRSGTHKTHVCIFMADYDSSFPLYDLLPEHWDRTKRGTLPFAWGINPNLYRTYPDLINYYYETAGPWDTFTGDASAAGYFNPSRIRPEAMPLFAEHNKIYYKMADMALSPMVLDQAQPTPAILDLFQQFSPQGYATIVWDMGTNVITPVKPQVWKGMPVAELINEVGGGFDSPRGAALLMDAAIKARAGKSHGYYLFRMVWISPSYVSDILESLAREDPGLDMEVLDPATFFASYKAALETDEPRRN